MRNYDKKHITIHNKGLSDAKDELTINIPIVNGKRITGLASIENRFTVNDSRKIEVKKLDEYNEVP